MTRFFETSLDELKARNSDVQVRFRRIDNNSFGCTIYREGQVEARCGIRRTGAIGFHGDGITYSRDDTAPANTINEQLTAEHDEQSMWLRPIGMQMHGDISAKSKLSFEGGAEYFWELLISPLQNERRRR